MTDVMTQEEQLSEISGHVGTGLLTKADGRSIAYAAHPLAELFPMIGGAEFEALVADVRERGVQRPIVLLDGKVLDGRNRYMAAREVGCTYPVVEFTGEDPLAFVISENMRRRHMTESQRAMVAAKIAKLPPGRKAADVPVSTPTQPEAAASMNVGERSVRAAKSVIDHGTAELAQAVEAGEVSVSAAAEVAKLPEAEQDAIVEQGPAAVRAAAKASRQPKADTATAPEPRPKAGLSGLTREALEDEVTGLRDENADLRTKLAAASQERDSLKARLAEATSTDQGKVIGALQKQVQASKYARDEAMAATKRMERKLKTAEARVKELEGMSIQMDAA